MTLKYNNNNNKYLNIPTIDLIFFMQNIIPFYFGLKYNCVFDNLDKRVCVIMPASDETFILVSGEPTVFLLHDGHIYIHVQSNAFRLYGLRHTT